MAEEKRMARGQYWVVTIVLSLVISGLLYLGTLASWVGYITGVIAFGLELAQINFAVMRLHDTDRSGWHYLWILLPIAGPIVLLVFLCMAGTKGPNRYGDVPKN